MKSFSHFKIHLYKKFIIQNDYNHFFVVNYKTIDVIEYDDNKKTFNSENSNIKDSLREPDSHYITNKDDKLYQKISSLPIRDDNYKFSFEKKTLTNKKFHNNNSITGAICKNPLDLQTNNSKRK